jgi:dienelactone hydrolase
MKGFLSPKTADPRVQGWTSPHYHVSPDKAVPQGILVLVFPGTTGKPRDYRKFADQAGALGLHCLVLRYPNDISINELAAGDPAAHLPLRLDHWDGIGRTGKVSLAPGETIGDRLQAAMSWLDKNRPGEGWGRFLSEGAMDWTKVAAVGHSLGGGYAALLAKHHSLDRCAMLGWADWDRTDGRLADWVLTAPDWETPALRRFWVGHERDEMVPREVGEAMGAVVVPAARSARIESDDPPWGRARILWTDLEASGEWPTGQPCHNSLALDIETPRWPDGSCVLADLWTWILVGRGL